MSPKSQQPKPAAGDVVAIERERLQFKELVLANPNYFGNLADSQIKPVKKIIGNTFYEELTCIGYNPDANLLEATIQIKRPTGYGGTLCQPGTREYVRFFVNYGGGWVDAGVVATNVHDLPNANDCAGQPNKPLSYVVTQRFDPKRDRCGRPILPQVRAILSWEWMPPVGNENWPPVWGNVLECRIQIKPRRRLVLDFIDDLTVGLIKDLKLQPDFKIKIPTEYEPAGVIPIPLPDPPPFELAELAKMYKSVKKAKDEEPVVEPHRFGLSDIQEALAAPAFNVDAATSKSAKWKALGLDLEAAIAALAKTQANVDYEELECVGLDNNLERLVATLHIKRQGGYSGDLCHHGSFEHVAFWADWDNTCEWDYLGTVSLNVHDIPRRPASDLCYSVILPVDLTKHRRNCGNPKIARIRAVLSWNALPSTTNPNALNFYGNRLDTHVQINPGPAVGETPEPIIGVLGGIPISKIFNAGVNVGLTKPDAFFALNGLPPDSLGRPCPFGGRVVLQGPSYPGYKYRVQVRKVGDIAWTTVTTTMKLTDLTGTIFTTQTADGLGFFTFVNPFFNIDNVLAWWDTTGDDLWEIKLELATLGDVLLPGVATHYIQLDNTAPEVDVHIDSGGDCKDFTVGATVNGHFVARDKYFGSYSLTTTPFAAPAGQLSPTSGTLQTAVAPGDAWSLVTTNMQPCGYVVTVTAVDRAIINSAAVGHYSQAFAGFCLRAKS